MTEMWIGATDLKEESIWTWTDCSQWNFTKWRSDTQPNNNKNIDGDGENCAVLHNNKSKISRGLNGWNDVPCNRRELHFVCKKPICSGHYGDNLIVFNLINSRT